MATGKPPVSTAAITGIKKMSPQHIIEVLSSRLGPPDNPYAITLYHDGSIGHCITLIKNDANTNRFIYHDPWPTTSLLCIGNNRAGIDARRVGKQIWSITENELESVIFASFVDPSWNEHL